MTSPFIPQNQELAFVHNSGGSVADSVHTPQNEEDYSLGSILEVRKKYEGAHPEHHKNRRDGAGLPFIRKGNPGSGSSQYDPNLGTCFEDTGESNTNFKKGKGSK